MWVWFVFVFCVAEGSEEEGVVPIKARSTRILYHLRWRPGTPGLSWSHRRYWFCMSLSFFVGFFMICLLDWVIWSLFAKLLSGYVFIVVKVYSFMLLFCWESIMKLPLVAIVLTKVWGWIGMLFSKVTVCCMKDFFFGVGRWLK